MLSPKEIVTKIIAIGHSKTKMPLDKLFILALLAGFYIGIGGLLAITVGGGIPEIQATNPGLQKFIFGAVFPLGLILVVVAGAELFTGNTALMVPGIISKQVSYRDLFKNWIIVYVGNFLGSIILAYFFAYKTEVFSANPWLDHVINTGTKKVTSDTFVIFIKAIACNWLVCLAIWLAIAAKNLSGKILGIWFPIMGFVAMGFEHCVANMFFIPTAIFYGAPISWTDFMINNLIPATLGNIIGGGIFVGMIYGYLYKEA